MWIEGIISIQICGVPLWVILLCGLVGVLVDVDHFIAHYWLTRLDARFTHTPLLIVSGIILFCSGAYLAGLLVEMVLR